MYAVTLGKKEAMQLQAALTESSVEDFVFHAIGKPRITMEEKLAAFTEKYSGVIPWLEEENAEQRAEWQIIEEQENFTGLNQYRPPLDDN